MSHEDDTTVGAAACKAAEQCLGKHLVRGEHSSAAGEGTRASCKASVA